MSTVPPWEAWGCGAGLVRTWHWARAAGLFYLAFCIALLAGTISPLFSVPPELTVPSVFRQSQGHATRVLAALGLQVVPLDGGRLDAFPAGAVVAQSLPAGKRVRAGRTIYLKICDGAAHATVPAVQMKDSQAALAALSAAGLNGVVATTTASAVVPLDGVVSQVPAPGLRVAFGSTVALVTSSGPPDTADELGGDGPVDGADQDSMTIINYTVPPAEQNPATPGPEQPAAGQPGPGYAAIGGAGSYPPDQGAAGSAARPLTADGSTAVRLPPTTVWLPAGSYGAPVAPPLPTAAAADRNTSSAPAAPGTAAGEGASP